MLASRLPGILLSLTPRERLEISLIESLGTQRGGCGSRISARFAPRIIRQV